MIFVQFKSNLKSSHLRSC